MCQKSETSSPVFAVARRGLMWCWAHDFWSACWSWVSSVFWICLLCHVLESLGNPVEENNVLKMNVARPTTAQKRTRRFLWWKNGVSLVQSEGWEIIAWRWRSWIAAMEYNTARRQALRKHYGWNQAINYFFTIHGKVFIHRGVMLYLVALMRHKCLTVSPCPAWFTAALWGNTIP